MSTWIYLRRRTFIKFHLAWYYWTYTFRIQYMSLTCCNDLFITTVFFKMSALVQFLRLFFIEIIMTIIEFLTVNWGSAFTNLNFKLVANIFNFMSTNSGFFIWKFNKVKLALNITITSGLRIKFATLLYYLFVVSVEFFMSAYSRIFAWGLVKYILTMVIIKTFIRIQILARGDDIPHIVVNRFVRTFSSIFHIFFSINLFKMPVSNSRSFISFIRDIIRQFDVI